MSNKIRKILSVGDVVYTVLGKAAVVLDIDDQGFETNEDYYRYDEHRKYYFLTKTGMLEYLDRKGG